MTAVMISIQPKWCELIASGKKTIEIRKIRPRIGIPFKCYIYCTNTKTLGDFILCKSKENAKLFGYNTATGINKGFAKEEDIQLKGKVIGEFICDKVVDICIEMSKPDYLPDYPFPCTGLTDKEILNYLGNGNTGYGWHISDLVIYDTPKEWSEFYRYCGDDPECDGCKYLLVESNESVGYYEECCSLYEGCKPLSRPPQSWCYIEEGNC